MESMIADEQLKEDLERIRSRLLDLSSRNQLLNYSHPRASSLRIVDEVPALVLERLVADGEFRFAALKSPDAPTPSSLKRDGRRAGLGVPSAARAQRAGDVPSIESDDPKLQSQSDAERREATRAARVHREQELQALAQRLGVDPSYDLQAVANSDAKEHADRQLQTLLSAEELESRLQNLRSIAVTAIQESGANMLHLLFGFVEWTDVPGGKARMAPLVLHPVTLSRLELDASTHTYPYTVAGSGEDWSTNVTLQEKCRKDFSFVLPDIDPEENLETYFSRIESILKSAPAGWRVRRQLTLGLVSFGKILMWRDLDPATWPEDSPLLDKPLLREVLGTLAEGDDEDGTGEMRTGEYNIDKLPREFGPVPPIVVPADSSQHSVLVDVQRGHNLVVQGPPGTGKSQTITNIIADAIASHKKVLFVAEKKAALEVVSRRLRDAGLGPFCLPLHSHTSNKREFLDGLKERIDLAELGNSDAEMGTVEHLLSETRAELTGHTDRLHAPFGSLGDTAFSIFWRSRRLAAEMPSEAIVALRDASIPNAAAISPTEAARQRAALTAFAAAHSAVAVDSRPGYAHPWHGVSRDNLRFDDSEALVALAREAHVALANADRARQSLQAATDGVAWPESSETLEPLLSRCCQLAPPPHSVRGALIEAIHCSAGAASTRSAVQAAELARQAWSNLPEPWRAPGAVTEPVAADYAERIHQATLAFGDSCTVARLSPFVATLSMALQQLSATEALVVSLAAELGVTTPFSVGPAIRFIELVLAAEQLPEGALTLRSSGLTVPGAAERVAELAARASALIAASEQLDVHFTPQLRPPFDVLREMATGLVGAPRFLPSLFSSSYRRAVVQYRQMTGGRQSDRATMTLEVNALVRHVGELDAFANERELAMLFGPSANGMRSPFASAVALLKWTKGATTAFRGAGELGRAVHDAVWSVNGLAWSEVGARAVGSRAAVESATALHRSVREVAAMTTAEGGELDLLPFGAVREKLGRWHTVAVKVMEVARHAGAPGARSLEELRGSLEKLRQAWAAESALAPHTETFGKLGIRTPTSDMTTCSDVLAEVRGALTYLAQLDGAGVSPQILLWLARGDQAENVASLQRNVAALRTALADATAKEGHFFTTGAVDLKRWYEIPPANAALTRRAARLERAILASGSLARYVTLLRERAAVMAGPLPVACGLLESDTMQAEHLAKTYDYVLARSLATLVLRERPELDRFSGDLHEKRRTEFASLDERFITLTQRIVAQRANEAPRIKGVSYGPVKDLTEQSLIEREIEKARRHIPIREMFKRAGNAIQSLKPCIMMGPQAVAQYLPPGLFQFDLVVMDEASQMRPEDALGAIVRGSQVVVVGDPKQLGPSNFFASQGDDDEELDEAAAALAAEAAEQEVPRGASVLERSESILLAATRRYPTRMLRWHYRSKYPELIAFSNQEFYSNELVLFPHPGSERAGDGINFRPVDSALYSASTNLKEAQDVLEAVRKHAAECPERTLLVVTMNQRQRELIDTMIQGAEKDDATLAAFRARHEGTLEPFSVKNLENVQGDERDTIYVSVTYGPDARGIVNQRFGPVNMVGGERRLNVLFTRAKYRLDVFCSFDPTLLRVTDASPRGLCVLRDYLRFAKEKTLATGRFTAKEPDSDFEIEVARALRGHGLEVHPQVGVAGYFLDLAVVDPKRPGSYILAVECDGATYHSAKSARDRDRLRQGVLEGLGWNVHRIWSTDWFRDPRSETLKTVRRVEQLVERLVRSNQIVRNDVTLADEVRASEPPKRPSGFPERAANG